MNKVHEMAYEVYSKQMADDPQRNIQRGKADLPRLARMPEREIRVQAHSTNFCRIGDFLIGGKEARTVLAKGS